VACDVTGKASYRVTLEYTQEQRRDYATLVGMLRREWGIDQTEDLVLRALREAAART
jgi:hypothetical protein